MRLAPIDEPKEPASTVRSPRESRCIFPGELVGRFSAFARTSCSAQIEAMRFQEDGS